MDLSRIQINQDVLHNLELTDMRLKILETEITEQIENNKLNNKSLLGLLDTSSDFSIGFIDPRDKVSQINESRSSESLQHSAQNFGFLKAFKKEFWDLVCNEKSKYKKERNLFGKSAEELIKSITAMMVATIHGLLLGAATALVAAFLMLLVKMGKSTFCAAYAPN